jgi:hypothetical protein
MSFLSKPNVYRQVRASSSEKHIALVVFLSPHAVPVLASFAVIFLMRRLRVARIRRSLNLNSIPYLDAAGHSIDVGLLIEFRLAQMVALGAALVVHSDVVTVARVLANRDGDDQALPAARGAFVVVAYEAPGDVGVPRTNAAEVFVVFEEGVVELIFLKFVGDLVVKTGEHGPRTRRLLPFLVWHDGQSAGCFWSVWWLALMSRGS